MALLPDGSLANVYGSLDLYLSAQLITVAGLSVRLHGMRRFVPPTDNAWVEAHYDFLGLQSSHKRQVGGSYFGTERQGYVQLNCYQRARVFPTRYTTAAARDLVVAAFPEGGLVPIYDVVGAGESADPAQVGDIILDGIQEHVGDTGMRSGVIQHVVSVQTRYLEVYTRT